MADNKITIELSVEGNATVELKQAQKAVQDFSAATTDGMAKSSAAFDVFTGVVAGGLVLSALSALKDAAVKLFDVFVVQGIKAAQEQEDSINKLNVALQISGKYSADASKDMQEFASELQRNTKFSDESILSNAALIESLGNLDSQGLKKATKAAVDMAAALGIDLESASRVVGKAVEGNTAALHKYGIQLDASGTSAEVAAKAIEALSSKFGGAAEGQVNTFSGAIAKAANQFNEIQETVGGFITQNQVVIAVINMSAKLFADLNVVLQDNRKFFVDLVGRGVLIFVDSIHFATAAMEGFIGLVTKTPVLSKMNQDMFEMSKSAHAAFEAMRTGASESEPPLIKAGTAVRHLTEDQKKLKEEADKIAKDSVKQSQSKAEQINEETKLVEKAHEQQLISDKVYADANRGLDDQFTQNKQKVVDTYVQKTIEENQRLQDIDAAGNAARIADNDSSLQSIIDSEGKFSENSLKISDAKAKREKQIDADRMKAGMDALSALASFQTFKTKELQVIGKAAAIAQTTISTYQGATGAFAALSMIPFVGPALAVAAAAAIVAAGLANVAKISGVDLAGGIDEVPAGYPNDTFRANLSSKERVVPAQTNQGLKAMIADHFGQKEILMQIRDRLDKLENNVNVNVGGRELINAVNQGLRSGRKISS